MENPWKSEAQFQAECTKWYDKEWCGTHPGHRGRLMLLYNNPPNKIIGPMLVSMGMRRGSSDQLYLYTFRRIAFIEYKIGYGKQSDDQIRFMMMVTALGWEYYVVSSKEQGDISEFTGLIYKLNQV